MFDYYANCYVTKHSTRTTLRRPDPLPFTERVWLRQTRNTDGLANHHGTLLCINCCYCSFLILYINAQVGLYYMKLWHRQYVARELMHNPVSFIDVGPQVYYMLYCCSW